MVLSHSKGKGQFSLSRRANINGLINTKFDTYDNLIHTTNLANFDGDWMGATSTAVDAKMGDCSVICNCQTHRWGVYRHRVADGLDLQKAKILLCLCTHSTYTMHAFPGPDVERHSY
jgi:hypothetical protein